MKIKILLLLLISSSTLFCQSKEHKTYFDNGKIKEIGSYNNEKKEGLWKTYYENGQLETEGKYINDNQEGEWKEYYENGQLGLIVTFRNGMGNGNVVGYHENGEISGLAYYIDNVLEGKTKEFNEDGNLLASGTMSKDEKIGAWIENEYFKNGKLKEHKEILNEEKHGKYTSYYENGNLEQDAFYKEGELHGDFKEYFENGKLKQDVYYKDGELHGEIKSYYENGVLGEAARAVDGKKDGKYFRYYKNGNKKYEEIYRIGKRNGSSKSYYKNGKLEESGNYSNNKKNGLWKEYDKDGLLTSEGNYILVTDEDNSTRSKKNGTWKYYKVSSDGIHYLSSTGEYVKGEIDGRWNNYSSDGTQGNISIYKNGDRIEAIKYGKEYIIENKELVGYKIWENNVLMNTVKYDDEKEEKLYKIYVTNNCNKEVEVVIRIYNSNKKWENHGWYGIKPGESAYLEDTKNSIVYYYAKADKLVWEGDNLKTFNGDKLAFKKIKFKKGNYGKSAIALSCN